jgi:hypothetical protein
MKPQIHSTFLAFIVLLVAFSLLGCIKAPPLSVVQRDSIVGEGKVLIITNASDEYLHNCTIKIQAANGNTLGQSVFAATLKPHESIEIGWLELGNWTIEPGQIVTLGARGYGTCAKGISK